MVSEVILKILYLKFERKRNQVSPLWRNLKLFNIIPVWRKDLMGQPRERLEPNLSLVGLGLMSGVSE